MSLLDDLTPATGHAVGGSIQLQSENVARLERARALAEARAQALECASRVFAGQPGEAGPSGQVLRVADRFLDWLLRPESDQP